MTSEDHRYYRELLGAFLLGELDEGEREAVEEHIEGCETCQAEMDELRPIVSALEESAPQGLEEPRPSPPPELRDRVMSRVRDSRRVVQINQARRRRRLVGSGLAAAATTLAVVIGLSILLVPSLLGPSGSPTEQVSFSQSPSSIEAEAELIDHTWGTETVLTGSGFEEGQTYNVALLREDGTRVRSGTFIGTGDNRLECNLTASLLREDATRLMVSTSDEEQVLNAELPDVSGEA